MNSSEEDFHAIDLYFAKKIWADAPKCVSLFLSHLLKRAREGHICVFLEHLDQELLEGALLLPDTLFEKYLVKEKNRIYLRRNWEHEKCFLTHLKRLSAQSPKIPIEIDKLQTCLLNCKLNSEQQTAILKAAKNTITVISGGPGTGKTFTAATLIRLFLQQGIKKVAVAAPTGKAAANMRYLLQASTEQCTTLHALLKKERIFADLIVVDESSMIDAALMAKLLSAVNDGARLILLGDRYQLPPIESGHFFSDLFFNSEIVVELKKCLRTEFEHIIHLANAVKEGALIPAEPFPSLKTLLAFIMEKQHRVLTPLRKGLYGVDSLNALLYQEHQRRGLNCQVPIMIRVNDPYLELFNGDTGVLIPEEKSAYFAGERKIAEHLLPPYEFAYALSVHKSQGSEYDNVIVLLPKGAEMFGKEMLYTAITRAKKEVTLFAEDNVIEQLLSKNSSRLSGIRPYEP